MIEKVISIIHILRIGITCYKQGVMFCNLRTKVTKTHLFSVVKTIF